MIKNKPLGRTLLLALALVVFLAASGNAAADEANAEGMRSLPSHRARKPRPRSSWGSSPRPSTF